MDSRFDNKGGGDQNIAQGDHAIGKQVNNYGISSEVFARYAGDLAVTDAALASFFKILEEQQVPRSDLDSKLREIAGQYKELLLRLETVQSEDLQMVKLKKQAKQAIEAVDYAKAEALLNQAEERDMQAIEELEQAARKRRISAAATNADQAKLQRMQLRYAKAAVYWQKAADVLPLKQKRADYLVNAGYDLQRIACYNEALSLYEQSLSIYKKMGARKGEGRTLCNIGEIHSARKDYAAALKYLEQSLTILQDIGDRYGEERTLNNIGFIHRDLGEFAKALHLYKQSLTIQQAIGDRGGEGTTLNNIGEIHRARKQYDTALEYLKQSLTIQQEVGNKYGEGAALNNIGLIYDARGKYGTALKYLEPSLGINQNIGDRRGEAKTSWNIGCIHEDQGDLAKAEQYINRAVELAEEIGHPKLEEWRKALEEVQVERRGRRDVSQNTPTVFCYSAQGVTLRLLNITPLGQGESARLS